MLVSFSVENFRSFGEEQTFSLVASKAQKGHETHCIPIANTDEQVLRVSLVYGANAAGKSNLVRAIAFARELIIAGPGPMKRLSLNRFRFTEDQSKPSSFEFRFVVGERLFTYGFEVTPDAVALEAIELLGARPNQLLLNVIHELDPERIGALLQQVVWWFSECLEVVEADASFAPMIEWLDAKRPFREFAASFLEGVATGIGELSVQKTSINAESIPKPFLEGLQSVSDVEGARMPVGSGMSIELDPEDATRVIRRNLTATHNVGGKNFTLPFQEESDGTQRLMNLLPALYHLKESCKVYVIDELDRSLHPLLSHSILKFFVETCSRANQQLIVTSHETHLLDQELLRRDEIWFADKDESQQTRLYSLSEHGVRNDLRLERGYLQGRFGGVPTIHGMDRVRDLIT
ncbi:unnamed protein product, partial [Symbiodinium sp. CCMP2456]